MLKDDVSPTVSRRNLASAALLTLVGSAAAVKGSTLSPDAELIRFCTDAIAMNREYLAIIHRGFNLAWDDPEIEAVDEAARVLVPPMQVLSERIAALPARTLEGIEAKARVARCWLLNDADSDDARLMRDDDVLFLSLVQDVLSGAW